MESAGVAGAPPSVPCEAPPERKEEGRGEDQPAPGGICEPCEAPWLAAGVAYQRKFISARSEGLERTTELWLCGSPAASLLCWPHITGAGTCTCNGKLAHILHGACGRAINGALGRAGKSGGCLGTRCRAAVHPTAEDIRAALGAWWQQTHSEPPEFTMAASQWPAKASENTAAATTSSGGGLGWPRGRRGGLRGGQLL